MVQETLKELGLSEKEIIVFRVVLEYGKLSPARISALTDINRTTVYAVAKDLVQKGFFLEDSLKGAIYYTPTPPKDLVKVAKKERQALINKELLLEELAKEVKETPRSKTYAIPKVKFIEGEDKIEEFLYEANHLWMKNYPQGTTWWGFQDHTFVEHKPYLEWIDWQWKHMPKNIDLKLLSNDTQPEQSIPREKYPRRNIKFWKKSFNFTTSQWIVGDYSIMIQTREKPHYLVETYDAVYAQNMRELFKNLWDEVK